MTTKLDDIIFGRNIAHRLSTSMGYDWITSIDVGTHAHRSAVAALLLEAQKLNEQFKDGGVIADLDNEIEARGKAPPLVNWFQKVLNDTIFEALPGIVQTDEEDRVFDTALMLTMYGAVCDKLPETRRAHMTDDANVQTGKLAVFGDTRSAARKFADRVAEEVKATALAFKWSEFTAADYRAAVESHFGIDDVAAAGLRAVKAYTAMVEAGELEISNERAIAIFNTMSNLNVGLRCYTNEDCWHPRNEDVLNSFDTIMEDFQRAVVARLSAPESPRAAARM